MILTRALTGVIIRPDGNRITTGRVVVTPVQPVPADGVTGVLAPTKATYNIVDGQINGEIIAPCAYIFEVYDGEELVWRFRRNVAAVPTPTTIQTIYHEQAVLPDPAKQVIFEGDPLTLLGSAGVPAGRVPAATGTGTITWSTAGAGDMTKAVYDADGDGIVDAAESVPWSGVTDKPATFPPAAHASTHATGGSDAITPAAIDAAPSSHQHAGSDITSQVASAATADSAPWAGITGKPATYPPESHQHPGSDITSQVASAAAADTVPWTGVSGKPSTFPPETHAATHATGGGDALTPAAIGAAAATHQHDAGDLTSGQLAPARGGTGADSSSWSGVPLVTAGAWAAGATAADVAAIPREAGIVSLSASRDLQLSDAGHIIEAAGTITITAPNGLPAGFQATIVNVGTGTVTLAAAGALQSKGGRNKLTAQYAAATLYHRGSDVWLAIGDLSA